MRSISAVVACAIVITARALVAQDAAPPPSFEAYSKFDFVPGEKVVAMDDFSQDAVGDFPDKWNTDGSGEIVTISGKTGRWLKLTRGGFFTPEFIKELPDNFTLEFDLLVPPTFDGDSLLTVALVGFPDLEDTGRLAHVADVVSVHGHSGAGRRQVHDGDSR